jgi:hypothetical protein
MKDSRIGESLWFLWDLEESRDGSLFFYTEGHVDVEHEVVRRALASALQREGIAFSLGQGFQLIDLGDSSHGYSGKSAQDDGDGWPCNEHGETEDGSILDSVMPVTWVRVFDF